MDGFERARVEYIYNKRVASNGSSTSEAEIGDANSGVSRRGKERIRRIEHLDGEYNSYSWGNRPEYANSHSEDIRNPVEPLRLRSPTDQWGVPGRLNHVRYHDEGMRRRNMDSCYEQSERARYSNHDLNGPSMFENLENNRAELLRKLDELKDQISQSCDVTEKPIRTGTDRRMISPTTFDPYTRNYAAYVPGGLTSSHGVNKQPLGPDDMAPPYLSRTTGFVPYNRSLRDSYHQRGYPHEYVDKHHQEIYRSSTQHLQAQYRHLPYNEHFLGFHGDVNHELFVSGPDGNLLDKPACSCVQCRNRDRYLPPKIDPSSLYNKKSQNVLPHPQLYPIQHGPQGYTSGSFNLHTSQLSTKIESESDGIYHELPKKVVLAHRNGQVWRPIAGGAPIITCSNCFKLLKLPRRCVPSSKVQQKLKCGACSSIILFELGNRGSLVPVSNHMSLNIDVASSLTVDENVRYQHDGSHSAGENAFFNDCDDSESKASAAGKKSISGESEKSSLSEDNQTLETLPSGKHGFPSAEILIEEVNSFPHPRLSYEECLDHHSANIVVNGIDKGNKSKRSDFEQNTPRKDYVEYSAVATETDMSLNGLSNSGVSEDSMDKSEEHHPMVNKGAKTLFGRLIKKSLGNFTKSRQILEVCKSQVFVNGHLIADHLVEKAEELAGPIQPGEYWYDVHAGFWGVIGHPCLGVVMPNIEEFNYPMPNNCGAGNTGVFVNGRELHQKDLNLLTSRGLPNTRNGSYLVEISGKVVDEYTGEELHNLGRLAPSVERAKHGFGMKVPSFIARLQS